MHTPPTTAQLAGQAIANAVAHSAAFDPAALRTHAYGVMAATGTPEDAMAFATQLHTTLIVLAQVAERG